MNEYDKHGERYANLIHTTDEWGFSPYLDLVVPALLQVTGEVENKRVLDACCEDGLLARLLAARGAHVVGIDKSDSLIERAQRIEEREIQGILYFTHDLTQSLPEYAEYFDLIACNLALNDVVNHVPFVGNLADVLRVHGVLAVSMNSPYSAVVREKVANYFDSGRARVYSGLAAAGVPAVYYHRTLEEYFSEFKRNGLYVSTLLDVKPSRKRLSSGSPKPKRYYQFPFFMVLKLIKFEARASEKDRAVCATPPAS